MKTTQVEKNTILKAYGKKYLLVEEKK